MEIEKILNCFNKPEGRFPIEALNAALEQREAITPHLLTILEHTISNYEHIDLYRMDYIFSLYLLSKFKEKKALPYILAFAALPGQWPENLLGDCITEGLASFIVSTFDNDLSPIKKIVEGASLNQWSRNAALKSLVGLVALQKLQREELIDYIRSLFQSALADDEDFVTDLVKVAGDLYPEELMEEINRAFEEEKVDLFVVDKKWIKGVLAKGKEKCLETYVYGYRFHLPIDDVEKEMRWMSAFHSQEKTQDKLESEMKYDDWDNNDYDDDNDFDLEIATPYVRSIPKVGRNDPCSCGSGKKFKKCCLIT